MATRRTHHETGVYTREDDARSCQTPGLIFPGLPKHVRGECSLFDQTSRRQSGIDLGAWLRADPIIHLPADLLIC